MIRFRECVGKDSEGDSFTTGLVPDANGKWVLFADVQQNILSKTHTGMRIDHSGILGRIAAGCRVRKDQRFMLGELDKHLMELAMRFYSGDIRVVDQFLQLYCLDDLRPEQATTDGEHIVRCHD